MSHNFRSCIGSLSVPVLVLLFVLTNTVLPASAAAPPETDKPWYTYEGVLSEFTTGVYLLESGSVLKAVDHLETAWRRSGHEEAVGRILAEGYFILKNFTRCEMITDELLSKNATDYEALLLKAKVRYIRRDPESALVLLESIRDAHGPHFEVERLLGNISSETGDIEKALEAYKKCINVNSSHPYIFYRYGLLLARTGRYAEAEEALKKAIELDPGFSEPALELAELYVETGRDEEAVPLLEGAVANDTANVKAFIRLADFYLAMGRLDQGIQLLEGRRAHAPLPKDAEIILGRLYYQAKEYGEAFGVFVDLFEKEQNSPELARILGEICLKMGDVEKSEAYFDRAIEINPDDYRSYLGKFFASSPDFSDDDSMVLDLTEEERIGLLTRAGAMIEGFDFDANYLLGVSYISVDSLRKAEIHLLRAKELKNNDEGTLLNLANIYDKLGRFGEAEACLVALYALKPDDPAIKNFYGYLLAQMGKELQKAERLVLEALRSDPENGYYLDSLGWVYYQMGDYDRAVFELEKASQRVSDDPVILEHLGDAYRAMHRFDEARSAYEKSSSLQGVNSEILEKIESTNQDPE